MKEIKYSKKLKYKMIVKSIFTLIVFMISFFGAQGQTLSSGGWRTSVDNPFTRITVSNNLETNIYKIECTTLVDAPILQFKITVDGTVVQAIFQEGSYVVVEGKMITIQQLTPGIMVKGTWAIIQQPETSAITIPWNYYTSLSNDLLVATLKVEQEFLLSINYSTLNCSNTSFTVFIDGLPVKDENNNILKFLEGSTIYGKGKLITIRATGTCNNNTPIGGDLKLSKGTKNNLITNNQN
ncbi:hypothetical protein [Gramella sp. AN32]|uniref:IgGFc-binding protein N-terminal domain-containing protein n=1 Tax=Christiangramia antarctica TaxID=2058158 RepID=A0ABW5X6S2_9FLAO|nr:hypothetical protein [Gramella sp. AN32]MCM4155993.1 hypothetical protein [Gramella sp. AN32]